MRHGISGLGICAVLLLAPRPAAAQAPAAAATIDRDEAPARLLAETRRCYRQAGVRDPGGFPFELRLTVAASGKVKKVESRGFDAAADKCVVAAASAWTFAEAPRDVVIDAAARSDELHLDSEDLALDEVRALLPAPPERTRVIRAFAAGHGAATAAWCVPGDRSEKTCAGVLAAVKQRVEDAGWKDARVLANPYWVSERLIQADAPPFLLDVVVGPDDGGACDDGIRVALTVTRRAARPAVPPREDTRAFNAVNGVVDEIGTGAVTLKPSRGGKAVLQGVDGAALGWQVGDHVWAFGPPGAGKKGGVDCTDESRCRLWMLGAGDVSLRHVSVHEAARFVAGLHGARVIVVGAPLDLISLDLRGEKAQVAFAALAAASGLVSRPRGDGSYWLGPRALLDRAEAAAPLKASGKKVDLSVSGAPVARIVRLIGAGGGLDVRGTIGGTASVFGSYGAGELLGALAALGGVKVTAKKKAITLEGPGDLPLLPDPGVHPCPDPEGRAEIAGAWLLTCVPSSELQVVGVAWMGKARTWRALLRRRAPGPGAGLTAAVSVGDSVGRDAARVERIDAKGVGLGETAAVGPIVLKLP